jgi:uncharacterized protein
MTIADSKYVSLTTFRRNGEPVHTPVWIAPLADGSAGFTTEVTSGKVKRIRNNPSVVLRPCTMRGVVAEGAEEIAATASVLLGDEAQSIERAIKAKYGFMVTLIGWGGAISRFVKRGEPEPDCVVHLRFD